MTDNKWLLIYMIMHKIIDCTMLFTSSFSKTCWRSARVVAFCVFCVFVRHSSSIYQGCARWDSKPVILMASMFSEQQSKSHRYRAACGLVLPCWNVKPGTLWCMKLTRKARYNLMHETNNLKPGTLWCMKLTRKAWYTLDAWNWQLKAWYTLTHEIDNLKPGTLWRMKLTSVAKIRSEIWKHLMCLQQDLSSYS